MSKSLKHQLRKLVKNQLIQLSATHVDLQSRLILPNLLKNPQFCQANSIALFMSMPKVEIDTLPIIEYCLSHKKKVYLPRCIFKESEQATMEFLRVMSMDEVLNLKPEGRFNLRQPTKGDCLFDHDELDVMIVPGVAFTRTGERLGHGAGFYDKFLHNHRKHYGGVPYLIGVGLYEQCVELIPTEAHDWNMDCVFFGS